MYLLQFKSLISSNRYIHFRNELIEHYLEDVQNMEPF